MAPTKADPKAIVPRGIQGDDAAGKAGIERAGKPLNSRQRYFVDLVLSGKSHSEAYRTAYCKPDHSSRQIADQAYALSIRPNVRLALKASRYDKPHDRLLTKDDVLKVVAGIMMSETATRHERLRAAQVYATIAGMVPREMQSLLDVGADGRPQESGPLRIVVNVFQNAPSRVKPATPVMSIPVREVAPATTGGNGNGNGRH